MRFRSLLFRGRRVSSLRYCNCSKSSWDEKVAYHSEKELQGKARLFLCDHVYRRLLTENENQLRKTLLSDPSNVPVALSVLYGTATTVQGRESFPEKTSRESKESPPPIYPFHIYHKCEGGASPLSKTESPYLEDAIDFSVLDPDLKKTDALARLDEDELFRFGTSHPSMPSSHDPCGGCGALLHCNDVKLPGFIPVELFKHKNTRKLCQRCYILKQYKVALKLHVSPSDYPKTIHHIKQDESALLILIVDIVDFPGSIWPDILSIVGVEKRIILVGNKIDLIPQDQKNYLKNIESLMVKEFVKKCKQFGHDSVNVIDSVLVSAKTGYNIETLIDKVFRCWTSKSYSRTRPGNVYLLGTTNVGKSSIFNTLLDSDLCKIQAQDLIEKASIANVPGTTFNLLKFPIMRPDPSKLNERLSRLSRESEIFSSSEKDKHRKRGGLEFKVPTGKVGRTFGHDQCLNTLNFTLYSKHDFSKKATKRFNPFDPAFADGKWCFDTPGSISKDQIINLLTQEEICSVIPSSTIIPRSFLLRIGYSILLGGLARVDILHGTSLSISKHPLRATVFCSERIPIFILKTELVEDFLEERKDWLKIPVDDPSRLKSFPHLCSVDFKIEEKGRIQDVVLSSTGWITMAPKLKQFFDIRAWTPEGRGIVLREALLPNIYNLRGKRIKGTPAFESCIF